MTHNTGNKVKKKWKIVSVKKKTTVYLYWF